MDATDKMNDPAVIPNGEFVVKDSGTRTNFETGAVRDGADGKGFFHCLPYEAIEALAKLYEAGAKKYAKDNWKKGIPFSRYLDSLLRHALKLAERLEGRRPRRRRDVERRRVHLDAGAIKDGQAPAATWTTWGGPHERLQNGRGQILWLAASALLFAANVVDLHRACSAK
jgi:hypothetical protein